MHLKDLKYLGAYLVPLLAIVGIYNKGSWAYITPIFIFGLVPFIEMLAPKDTSNLSDEDRAIKSNMRLFDFLLYLNVPIVYGVILYLLHTLSTATLNTFETAGLIFSVGIVMGACGINVAHELGHRNENYHKLMAKALLFPSMYTHFIIEHNFGHHKNVATDEDPASARKNEMIYIFWLRSIVFSFVGAFKIEQQRIKRTQPKGYEKINKILIYQFLQVTFLALIGYLYGLTIMTLFLACSLISILLLETINYIEHYGLRRQKVNGKYERVRPIHSWNSNHEVGRILLYELTRHSDHHFIANKKYQLLDHQEESKQLPLGYPGSMLLSLVPPVWFKLMNHRI